MLKVGLTGGLASGKSFVAGEFEALGAHVIHADRLGHETLAPGGEAYDDVIREFGPDIRLPDGAIDRKRLAALVFADPQKLAKLNSLIHPHVYRRQEVFFEEVARRDPRGVAVVEAAILIETGGYRRYDRLVLAVCPPELQIERFIARENATEAEARQRLARQMPLSEKLPFADYVVDTSGSKEDTARRAREVYAKLKEEAERPA